MSSQLLFEIIRTISEGQDVEKLAVLHEPIFVGNEQKYVTDCIESGWVSSVGKYVDRIERDLESFTGVKNVVATVNGTSALHICFLLSGVSRGDEVLCPSLTFVATCNAISYCGALPHFVDIDAQTLGVNPNKLDSYLNEVAIMKNGQCYNKITDRRISSLCVMHTFGHPACLDELLEITRKYRISLVEDAAEALGSYYKNQHVGNHGLLSALSFNGNKIITTGGGGAILTNSDDLAKKAKHLTTTAKVQSASQFYHDQVAYNYRMPNINAALGCAQLEKIEELITQKRSLARYYEKSFNNIAGVKFFKEPVSTKSNYWLNSLLLQDPQLSKIKILNEISRNSIGVRPVWEPMHKLPMYSACPSMTLDETERLSGEIINIPSSAILGKIHNEKITA